tara:strand:+ start:837 stop:1532 length:696 start_codon:yes stop_codon:yes gene_type:complete
MKRVTIFFTLFCLSTIGITEDVPLYETITDNVPKIGITTEVYLGDGMLEQRTGDYRECIIPQKTLETFIGMMKFHWIVKANEPLCKKNADSKYYHATYNMVPSSPMSDYQARLKDNSDDYEIAVRAGKGTLFTRALTFKDLNKDDIEINGRYFLYQPNSFQQTIEYAGKSGNILKFVYSEFNYGFARDAFNREFQVDLNEGNVLAFKGALIEIESATNINIRYKVIRNFQD